jgi:methyl-accepting chemotaxis protein
MVVSAAAVMALQSAAPELARDTIVALAQARSGWETAASVSQVLIALVMVVLLAAILAALAALRRTMAEVAALFQASRDDIAAAARSVRLVAEDLHAVTTVARSEVEALADTLRDVNEGVQRLLRRVRSRLQRLDALAELAQEQAEDFVVSAAATLRGVRMGASVLRRGLRLARRNGGRAGRRFRRRGVAADVGGGGVERPHIATRSGSYE